MPELYYHILWPESQKWMDQEDAIEDGDVIGDDNGDCFVVKYLYDYVMGIDNGL